MKNKLLFSLIFLFSLSATAGSPNHREVSLDHIDNWQDFRKSMLEQEKADRKEGWAYMVSGGLLLVGGLVGYHNAQSPVEALAYAVTQSLGVWGMGYGAYVNFVGDEQRSFYETVENTNGLRPQDKDELVQSYAQTSKINRHNEKVIRIVTHSLVAVLNFYSASQIPPGGLRTGLMIIGGANALAAISLSF